MIPAAAKSTLAIHGGTPVRRIPFPSWPHFSEDEIAGMIRGRQIKLSNSVSVQLGIVPVHEPSHNATEEPFRARKLPRDESRRHND